MHQEPECRRKTYLWRCSFFVCWRYAHLPDLYFGRTHTTTHPLTTTTTVNTASNNNDDFVVRAVSTVGVSPNKPGHRPWRCGRLHCFSLGTTERGPNVIRSVNFRCIFALRLVCIEKHCAQTLAFFALLRPISRCVRTNTVQVQLDCNAVNKFV